MTIYFKVSFSHTDYQMCFIRLRLTRFKVKRATWLSWWSCLGIDTEKSISWTRECINIMSLVGSAYLDILLLNFTGYPLLECWIIQTTRPICIIISWDITMTMILIKKTFPCIILIVESVINNILAMSAWACMNLLAMLIAWAWQI